MLPSALPSRVAVEDVWPRVDDGRTPIRRVPGDSVEVYADVFADGSAGVRASLRWRAAGSRTWIRVPMDPVGNDRWRARFVVREPGGYQYGVDGWVDPFLTWRTMLDRRVGAGTVSQNDLLEGVEVLRVQGRRLGGREGKALLDRAAAIAPVLDGTPEAAVSAFHDPEIDELLRARPVGPPVGRSDPTFELIVDPPSAQHSAWYELFPRSTSEDRTRAGTFKDLIARLPYIADLGFDVVYLPPIHPIGRTHRRGPNNTTPAPPGSPGCPWAIGSEDGGHTAIEPGLGTLEDFRALVRAAEERGLSIAIDLAFQCAPDHPWVTEHPSWFHHLPDGSNRTAENPPKKYDDIYPIDFDTPDWRALWDALRSVVEFWVGEGVRWFRVDNPHTKPFEFWRGRIGEVRRADPEVLVLAEAFTPPQVMYRLALVGFTHSYTYFAWRTQKREIEEYVRELTGGVVGEIFRPHFWPNTPDILTEQFHEGKRAVFLHRLVLAATLSSHYGIYGPAYELQEHVPLERGKEEYRSSEKYEVRHWPLAAATSLAAEVRPGNEARAAHPALRSARGVTFHGIDNDRLLAYSRRPDDGQDTVLVLVSLAPNSVETGWTNLDLVALGVERDPGFRVRDLLTGETYRWQGARNFVRLDPARWPAHLFEVVRSPPPEAP